MSPRIKKHGRRRQAVIASQAGRDRPSRSQTADKYCFAISQKDKFPCIGPGLSTDPQRSRDIPSRKIVTTMWLFHPTPCWLASRDAPTATGLFSALVAVVGGSTRPTGATETGLRPGDAGGVTVALDDVEAIQRGNHRPCLCAGIGAPF